MATVLSFSADVTTSCGNLIFTDTTPIGSGEGYDTVGGIVLSSIVSTSLGYTNGTGTITGYLWEDWIPESGTMDHTIDYPSLLGVFQLTYTVNGLDDNGDPVTVTVSKMALFDCAAEYCLQTKVFALAKQGCGCCQGCGNGLSQEKIGWLWSQLEIARILFSQGYYDCIDGIIQSIVSKCDNACSSC